MTSKNQAHTSILILLQFFKKIPLSAKFFLPKLQLNAKSFLLKLQLSAKFEQVFLNLYLHDIY